MSLANAMRLVPSPALKLRTAQISFVGPVGAEIRIGSQVLRQGRTMTTVATDLVSGSALGVRSVFAFGEDRQTSIVHDSYPRIPANRPSEYAPQHNGGQVAEFLRNFDIRPAGGSQPFSGSSNPEITWWMKHRHADGLDPVLALVTMADALPPAAATLVAGEAPLSSVNWSFDLAGAPCGDWFLLRSTSEQACNGYSTQRMDVWDESGRRVLSGRQTVAIFA